jgi:uncharacterized protein with FMN-binding domain
MRRTILTVVATVVIVVGLLHYKTSSAPSSLRINVAGSQASTPATSGPAPGASPDPNASPTPSAQASGGTGTRTITGPVETNQFGPVQVQISVSGGKVTNVKTLQVPTDRARSAYISSIAGPLLTQEAVQAQSANIDNVSGASYTSYSFAQSLQAALSQAGL